jgi:hypothetical protein
MKGNIKVSGGQGTLDQSWAVLGFLLVWAVSGSCECLNFFHQKKKRKKKPTTFFLN